MKDDTDRYTGILLFLKRELDRSFGRKSLCPNMFNASKNQRSNDDIGHSNSGTLCVGQGRELKKTIIETK
jgi:hypothetical protein